jgi:transcriptional regulator with XRE-family HTH domain
MAGPSIPNDFARALGDKLGEFLRKNRMKQSEAAKLAGLDRERLNTYCHDSRRGTRPTPDAEVLHRLCANLGFELEYNGYRGVEVSISLKAAS